MKKILIVLGMGGHTAQMLNLVELMGNKYSYYYIIGNTDKISKKKITIPGRIYKMKNPRLMNDKSLIKVFFKMIPATIDALWILIKSKPNAIISCGPAISIPICYMGKLFGKKIIFLESWSRVANKSLSGKLIYPIADQFCVQWKELKAKYPKSIYAGRLG